MCVKDKRLRGTILKGIGGFYYVLAEDGMEYETKARGLFRKDKVTPMPGDRVVITLPTSTSGGYIEEILPRKNALPRPMVANVEQLVIVIAAKAPAPDLQLVDKLLAYAQFLKMEAIVVVNKCDQSEAMANEIAEEYAHAADALVVSAQEKEGLDALAQRMRGRVTCLAGQSAVGKSTLLNAICPDLALKTGELSKKTAKGRHTTRHSELLSIPELCAAVVDTPGFSILEVMDMEPEQLKEYYPEFQGAHCRFAGSCLHDREPGCEVKRRVEAGTLSKGRYERYIALLQALKERKDRQYD